MVQRGLHVNRAVFILCLMIIAPYGSATTTDELRKINLKNRTLIGILGKYKTAGYDIIYSDALVTDELINRKNPSPNDPLLRLKQILLQFNLTLWYDDITGAQFIVAQPLPANVSHEHSKTKVHHAIEEVIVTSSTYRLKQDFNKGARNITARDIENTPTRASDPVQIINTLPGIASSGLSAKPNIRGGDSDELLIVFDNIELLDPFHLKDFQSLISGINALTVQTMDIYTGGYPVHFGGKMSGVMNIATKDYVDDFNNQLSFNPFATSIQTQGSTADEGFGWLLSARRGNLDDTLEGLDVDIGTPRFHDVFAKSHWQITDEINVSVGYLAIQDDITLSQIDGEQTELASSKFTSQYGWVTLDVNHSSRSKSQWILTSADIKSDRTGSLFEPETPTSSVGTLTDKRDFDIVRLEYLNQSKIDNQHYIESGFRFEYDRADYEYHAQAELGELATLLGNSREVDTSVIASPSGMAGSIFTSYRYVPYTALSLEAGLRFDAQQYYAYTARQFSPRIALRYALTDTLFFKSNAGIFFQSPSISELNVSSGQSEFYSPQKSKHYILGLEYLALSDFQISIETYVKTVNNPKPRSENILNPYVFLPEISPDRVELYPDKVKGKGFEVRVDYSITDDIRTWLSFTTSEVDDVINDKAILRRWNQTQAIRTGFNFNYKSWAVDSQIQWHRGWRETKLPSTVENLDEALIYERNNRELPEYFAWDVRVSYEWLKPNYAVKAYLEILNFTDHDNVGGSELEITPALDGNGYDLTSEPQNLLPIIPSFGITIKF